MTVQYFSPRQVVCFLFFWCRGSNSHLRACNAGNLCCCAKSPAPQVVCFLIYSLTAFFFLAVVKFFSEPLRTGVVTSKSASLTLVKPQHIVLASKLLKSFHKLNLFKSLICPAPQKNQKPPEISNRNQVSTLFLL